MKANANLADFIRHVQTLSNSSTFTPEQIEEFEFYLSLKTVFSQVLLPGFSETEVPLTLRHCSFKKAQELATSLGFHVVEGNADIIYLNWSKDLNN